MQARRDDGEREAVGAGAAAGAGDCDAGGGVGGAAGLVRAQARHASHLLPVPRAGYYRQRPLCWLPAVRFQVPRHQAAAAFSCTVIICPVGPCAFVCETCPADGQVLRLPPASPWTEHLVHALRPRRPHGLPPPVV